MATYPELGGKVIIVTGASGNLGNAVAARLSSEGAKLALVDRDMKRLQDQAAGYNRAAGDIHLATADITKKAEVEAFVAEVVGKFGAVDGLINVAGGFKMGEPVYNLDEATYDFMMNLNAKSVFLMSGAVVKAMLDAGRPGRVVTVASRSALKGDPNTAAYNASKAVALRLTESLAAEVLDKHITVNAILPSVIDTPQNRQGGATDAEIAKWVTPDSLADVIAFLLSDAARDITGASIPVYGRA